MTYKGVVFDLDGTLLNTLSGLAKAMNNVLKQFDYPTHETEEYKHFIGKGIKNLILQALPAKERNEATYLKCLPLMQQEYHEHWSYNLFLYDGIADLLTELEKRNLKLAILTNKPDNYTAIISEKLLGERKFEIIVGASDDLPPKPDPTGAFIVIEELNILPAELLYLGDTATDMETANNAGIFAIGALWGFRDAEELNSAGADALISHPLELLDFLE